MNLIHRCGINGIMKVYRQVQFKNMGRWPLVKLCTNCSFVFTTFLSSQLSINHGKFQSVFLHGFGSNSNYSNVSFNQNSHSNHNINTHYSNQPQPEHTLPIFRRSATDFGTNSNKRDYVDIQNHSQPTLLRDHSNLRLKNSNKSPQKSTKFKNFAGFSQIYADHLFDEFFKDEWHFWCSK